MQKEHINGKGTNVITSGVSNYGILGKTDVKARILPSGSITVDMFGNVFYRNFEYKMVTHARVFSLCPKVELTDNQRIFIASALRFLRYHFGMDNMCTWDKIKKKKINLPITSKGEVDYAFMESYIAEMNATRLMELSEYLSLKGLNNSMLNESEQTAIESLSGKRWEQYTLGDLFDKKETKKLSYKAKDLPSEAKGEYLLPCLTSSFNNQGLNYYVPYNGATILKNVITLPSNSDVYRAYYQSSDFTVLSDAYAIDWIYDQRKLTREQYLFMVMCINKVTDRSIYSHKNKLGGWNVVKGKKIMLPVLNGQIDFDFMHDLISSIEKLIVKDVVSYTKKKIFKTDDTTN